MNARMLHHLTIACTMAIVALLELCDDLFDWREGP